MRNSKIHISVNFSSLGEIWFSGLNSCCWWLIFLFLKLKYNNIEQTLHKNHMSANVFLISFFFFRAHKLNEIYLDYWCHYVFMWISFLNKNIKSHFTLKPIKYISSLCGLLIYCGIYCSMVSAHSRCGVGEVRAVLSALLVSPEVTCVKAQQLQHWTTWLHLIQEHFGNEPNLMLAYLTEEENWWMNFSSSLVSFGRDHAKTTCMKEARHQLAV